MTARRRAAAALVIGVAGAVAWDAAYRLSFGASPYPFFDAAAVLGLAAAAALERGTLVSRFRPWRRPLAIGLAAGGVVTALTYVGYPLVASVIPAVREEVARLYVLMHADLGPAVVVPSLVLVILAEEVLFRGLLIDGLDPWLAPVGRHGGWLTIAVAALVYAGSQIASGQWALVAVAALLALVWGALRRWTGSLVAPLACHLVWDLFVLVLVPLV